MGPAEGLQINGRSSAMRRSKSPSREEQRPVGTDTDSRQPETGSSKFLRAEGCRDVDRRSPITTRRDRSVSPRRTSDRRDRSEEGSSRQLYEDRDYHRKRTRPDKERSQGRERRGSDHLPRHCRDRSRSVDSRRRDGDRQRSNERRSITRRSPSPRQARRSEWRGSDSYHRRDSHRSDNARHRDSRSTKQIKRSIYSSSSSGSDSSDSRSSRSDSEEEERRRRRRRREKRRQNEKEERRRHKDRKRDKKKRDGGDRPKATAASTGTWGKYGVISEASMSSKESEFKAWLIEERKLNPDHLSRDRTRKEFAVFVEDFNTATLPHEKYYDLIKYEARMNLIRSGGTLDEADEPGPTYNFAADMNAHKKRLHAGNEKPVRTLSRAEILELRRVEAERTEIGQRRLLGLPVPRDMGVRLEEVATLSDRPAPAF